MILPDSNQCVSYSGTWYVLFAIGIILLILIIGLTLIIRYIIIELEKGV